MTVGLGALIVLGSRNLAHFDAALVGYTFATLFAAFGITYRYAMWLQRPPTRMYWRRGWRAFASPRHLLGNLGRLVKRGVVEVAGNRFIFRRGLLRGLAHWMIMWGCLIAAAITFPLVWGWIHFETVPGDLTTYRTFVFGFAAGDFPVDSWLAFVIWVAGSNVAECSPITTNYIWQARELGAKVIVQDPRITPIARTCDLYLPVRPGRDAALFAAVLQLMIEHGWIDRDFIERETVGWDGVAAYCATWPVARAAEVTGVPARSIRNYSPVITQVLPFARGLTLLWWATASWWIPMLLILGVWRHLVRRFPLAYDPLYWGAVFPLGMYTVCTVRLATAVEADYLRAIAKVTVWIALAAWTITAMGMAVRLARPRPPAPATTPAAAGAP